VIDYIEDQKLLANCTETGAYMRHKLEELQDKHQIIGDIRGMGLLQAIELVEDRKSKTPATAATARVIEAARENRILLGKGGMFGNVIRFSPPMNIGKGDVDQFMAALDKSLAVVGTPLASAGASR
jgi:4-aminobutyrate aminotransferase-like enzyme